MWARLVAAVSRLHFVSIRGRLCDEASAEPADPEVLPPLLKGLAVFRTAWVNLDLMWAGALVLTGLLALIAT